MRRKVLVQSNAAMKNMPLIVSR